MYHFFRWEDGNIYYLDVWCARPFLVDLLVLYSLAWAASVLIKRSEAGNTRYWGDWSRAASFQALEQRLHLPTVPFLLLLKPLLLLFHLFLHQLD